MKYILPLKIVITICIIGALGISADIAQLSGINFLNIIITNSPYSYFYLIVAAFSLYIATFIFQNYKNIWKQKNTNHIMNGTASFDYSNNNGLFTIGTGEYAFDTMWTKASNTSIHAYNDGNNIVSVGYNPNLYDFFRLDDIDKFDFSSRSRHVRVGELIIWRNKWGKIAVTRILDIKDNSRGDESDKLAFKYKIFP